MSYQVGSACYDTPLLAAQAAASSQVGALVSQGGTLYAVSTSALDGASITYVLTPPAPGAPVTLVAPFTPQPCGLLEVSDGLALGWLVVGAWAAAYGLLALKHALMGETGPGYGNA